MPYQYATPPGEKCGLAVGPVSPILTLEKFFIVENTFSIISGLEQLVEEGKFFLFVIILSFSVVLPVCQAGRFIQAVELSNQLQ